MLRAIRSVCRFAPLFTLLALLAIIIRAASVPENGRKATSIDPDAMTIDLDRGAPGLSRCLAALRTRASLLMVTAHADDEDGGLLAYETRGLGARAAMLTLTRGEGGQNAMSPDLYDALGLVRTEELLTSDRYYGVDDQYWGREIDYGFSKTREEALEKWGYDRTLSDVVRVVRMTRPLIIVSVFAGAPTDGHGNHQVSGQMAQEAFVAAGDPNRFPEQIREGLRPWSPLKVYARVPFFEAKDGKIYDYATDKYVPVRFFDYVKKTWINERPAANASVAEGSPDHPSGLTYTQIGREGWGFQKSQNGGAVIPQPSLYTSPYHRYGSRVSSEEKEKSFYDGIDVSLLGIASLASGDSGFLKQGLEQISHLVDQVCSSYKPEDPSSATTQLAEGLKATRELIDKVRASSLLEPGKNDVEFELRVKERQFEKALIIALGISFDAAVAPEKPPTGPFAAFFSTSTFGVAIPGQAFGVNLQMLNESSEPLAVEDLRVFAADGGDWSIRAEKPPPATLEAGKLIRMKFDVKAPQNAALTKPYFSRPDEEQAYYDLTDERYRNLSFASYPLAASVHVQYHGVDLQVEKVVQANQHVEGIGLMENPLLMGPALSVSVSPAAGAVPLTAKSFSFSCTLHSNVKGPANGVLRVRLPDGWQAAPPEHPFALVHDGDNETLTFEISPHSVEARSYSIKAVAEYAGKTYEEGYRLTGYPGVRPYPYYRPATYEAVGVDVKTAPDLRVGFLPGTGDDVPRALEDLSINVQVLSGADIETGGLEAFDAIVLGVRAYAVRPELRAANDRLLDYVKNGGVLIVQYNLQNFDQDYGPYPFTLGQNPQKVVDETSAVKLLDPTNPIFSWPNKITEADFRGWQEERGHGFMQHWDPHYKALVETHDPDQDPQPGGLLVARYGRGTYVYDAFALYRQLPSGVPGAYRILANLVSIAKNPSWR